MHNRIIKFRIWDEQEKAYWTPEANGDSAAISLDGRVAFGYIDGDMSTDDFNKTVEQFTGLLDKNGKEIYEGDVLEFSGEHFDVSWCNSIDGYMARASNTSLNKWHWIAAEVVGNIHENPEFFSLI